MKKLFLSVIFLLSVITIYSQFSPTGAKTRFINGISLGTLGGYPSYIDSGAIYWRWDSTLMAKYKGTGRALAWAVSGGYLPLSGGTMTGQINMGGQNITNAASVNGTGATWSGTSPYTSYNRTSTSNISGLLLQTGGSNRWGIGQAFSATSENFDFYNYGLGANVLQFNYSTGASTFGYSVTAASFIKSGSANTKFLLGGGADVDTATLLQTRPLNNQFYDSLSAVRSRANSNVNYWQRPSTYVSPATAGDGIRVPDATNSYVTYIPGNGNISTGVNGGNQTSMGSDQFTFYQSAPNKYSNINTRNLTANRNIYFPNADMTVADSATVAGKLDKTGGTVTGTFVQQNVTNGVDLIGLNSSDGTRRANLYTTTTYTELQTTSTIPLYLSTNGTARITIDGSTGAALFSSLGTGTVYSNSGTLTNTNPSDSSLKDSIKVLQYGLKEILQLKPKTFYYRSDSAKTSLKYGFIAQDVQKVMPDMVRKLNPKDEKSKLGLETDGIYVTLINAIKEQQAQIEELKARILKLENK